MKKGLNKKIIIIICFVIASISMLLFFKFSNYKESGKSNVSEINSTIDDNDDEEVDFSDAKEININLSEKSGTYKITTYGIYILSGTIKGNIKVNSDDNIKIILKNATINSTNGPAIYIENAKNTYIEVVGDNNLKDNSSYTNYDTDVDGVIFSHDDLVFEGSGTINISSNFSDGIVSKDDLKFINGTYIINSIDDAIRGKDSVVIKNGTYKIKSNGDGIKSTNDTDKTKGYISIEDGNFDITSLLDGLQATTKVIINNGTFNINTGGGASLNSTDSSWGAWGKSNDSASAKGIKAGSNIIITNGNFTINSSDDSIHSNDSVGISNGTYAITSGDDGIHAYTSLVIDEGKINITKSYEGLEATNITINGGDIDIISTDDGINVAGGNDGSATNRPGANNYNSNSTSILTINNGEIYVNSSGDGLDANGKIVMEGGNVIVDGPTNNGNVALDYDTSFIVNDGTLIAAGSSGMAQNISEGNVNSIMINFSNNQNAKTSIEIEDVISYTPSKPFSSILFVNNKLKNNTTYNILVNNNYYTNFTVNSTINTIGNNNSPQGR